MKVFLDANVLVSVLNKEYPLFSYSSRILSLSSHKDFELYTSPLCLAIAFYFAEKKNKKTAKEKIILLAKNISIAAITATDVKKAAENPAIKDFEDGLEYYAATGSNCQCIITEDVNDFYFADTEVLNCAAFFAKYAGR